MQGQPLFHDLKSKEAAKLHRYIPRTSLRGIATAMLSFAALFGLLPSPAAQAQTNEWSWMGGSTTVDTPGVYGTLGTPAPGNAPGAREESATWTDNTGKLWLFGGSGIGLGFLNDLWEFDPSTDQWAWMGGPAGEADQPGVYGTKGTPAASNIPGARADATSWTDAQGNMWLFGGMVYTETDGSGYYNDLWKFNPSANEWTWISGPSETNQSGVYGTLGVPSAANMPGGRLGAVGWVDGKGNLWLFGGIGEDSTGAGGKLNDLWEFNPSTGQWTWVNGPNTPNQPSVPGILHTPAAGNVPASGGDAVGWTDSKGNLWLFGSDGSLNDLWEYNPSTNEWTWMNGLATLPSNRLDTLGVYGTLQTPAAANTPGGRFGAVSWTDKAGNFWLFGGMGPDVGGVEGELNDLWEFNPSTNEWAWMGGSPEAAGVCPATANSCGQPGIYGALQSPGLTVVPSGRYSATGWTDKNGYFWLLGGIGIDQAGDGGYLNDLWQFQPNTGGGPVAATPAFSVASGTYTAWQTLILSNATPGATTYYLIGGSTQEVEYTKPLTISSSETIEAIASASGYANSNIATATYTLNLPATAAPTFSLTPGSYTSAQNVTLSDTTPGAVIYYATGVLPATSFNIYSGPITVAATEQIQAYALASNYVASATAIAAYHIGSLPTPALWTWMNGSSALANTCYRAPQYGITCTRPGWYGTVGTPAAGNTPGGRGSSAGWTDSSGNLWMFGGNGYDGAGTDGLLNDLWKFSPSTDEWTWMGGSSIIDDSCSSAASSGYCGKSGVYGTMGTPAPGNTPGGREWPTYWTDSSGRFWLFGGWGFDASGVLGFLNDLWEYDPAVGEWTWMGGNSTIPALFEGYPGVYGTQGIPAPGNIPGSRYYTTSWSDASGHLWLYGGQGLDSVGEVGYMNDLWEYDTATNEWTWRTGLQWVPTYEGGLPSTNGIPGVPSPIANPGSRAYAESWTDSGGHLWLMGGYQVNTAAIAYILDDLWEFDPSSSEWTLMALSGGLPLYGQLGIPSADNFPGACASCPKWTDNQGNFWLYAGPASTFSTYKGNARDMWWFSPLTAEWTWMGGTTTVQGIYGALGLPAVGDSPSARAWAVTWTGKDGNLWLFGGGGYDANDGAGPLNDMWQYGIAGPPPAAPQAAATPTFSPAAGTYNSQQMVTISDQISGANIYYTTNGSTPNSASAVYSGPISISSSETIQAVVVADRFANSAVASASYAITLSPAATPTFSVQPGTYATAQTVTISDATAGATIYYTTNGTTPTTSSTVYSGAITVPSTETIQAIAVASGYSASTVASALYTIDIPPTFTLSASAPSLTVNSGGKGAITLTVTPDNGFASAVTFACSGIPSGASCLFNPPTVTPPGAQVSTILTISVPTTSADLRRTNTSFLPGTGLALVLGFFWSRKRLRLKMALVVIAAFAGLNFLGGCGGGNASAGGGNSTPVTSTVTVTATAGTLQQTATLALTVN